MDTRIETVSPSQAADWLANANGHNRKLSRPVVEAYRTEILEGRWKQNGVPLLFSHDGRLLDGQHRLAAIVAAARPVEMLIVSGLNPDVFDTIDCGRSRTANDALTIDGEAYPSILSGAVRICIGYLQHGTLLHKAKIPTSAVTQFIADNPAIRSDVIFVGELGALSIYQPPTLAALLFLSRTPAADNNMARRFVEDVRFGEGLTRENPALHLLNYPRTFDAASRMKRDDYILRLVLAFNAYNKGAKMRQLKPTAGVTLTTLKVDECAEIDTSLDTWARVPRTAEGPDELVAETPVTITIHPEVAADMVKSRRRKEKEKADDDFLPPITRTETAFAAEDMGG